MRQIQSILIAGFAATLCGFSASASLVTYDLSQQYTYGYLNQNDSKVNGGNNACGPTSAANSFIYLQNRYGVTGLVDPLNPYKAVNDLSEAMKRPKDDNGNYTDGVTIENFVQGKKDYIKGKQTGGPVIEVHYVKLTFDSIYDELVKGQDLEMWIDWPTTGAHMVTLTSITWNDSNDNQIYDNGDVATKLDFVDPIGGVKLDAEIKWITNDGWYLHYTGGGAGANGSDAYAKWIIAESPVPLPMTVWMGLATLSLMIGRRMCSHNKP